MRDVRFAFRLLAVRPGWSLAAILCLAIATGANTAAFSVVNALILRPLPFDEPDRLVMIALNDPERATARPFSLQEYRDVAARSEGSIALIARTFLPLGLAADDGARMVEAEFVSGNYFDALRVAPAAGRLFDAAADRAGANPVAVISHALFQRRFASDPSIVGQVVRVNRRPITVLGIAPPGFVGATRLVASDMWMPASLYAEMAATESAERVQMFGVIGRMSAGMTRDQARAQLDAMTAAVWRDRGVGRPPLTVVEAATGFGVPPVVRRMVISGSALIFGLMTLLFIVAAANVAALILARASGRRQEIGVRLALGASRARIATQMLTESVVLAVLGGAGGWALALAATRVLASKSVTPFEYVSYAVDIQPDVRVLGYAIAATMLTAGLVGLAPVLHSTRLDLIDVLKRSSSVGRRGASSIAFRGLVVSQFAVSTALLVGSGLLVRTYLSAQDVDAGINAEHIVAASVDMSQLGVESDQGRVLFDELVARLSRLPSVSAVSATRSTPLSAERSEAKVWRDEIDGQRRAGPFGAESEIVDAQYFPFLSIPLVQGRAFNASEPRLPLVAIVNETMARQLWPNQSAVGKTFRAGGPSGDAIEVVGVAKDVKYRPRTTTQAPVFYQPFSQLYSSRMTLLVRSNGDAKQQDIRREIEATNRDLAIQSLRTLDQQLEAAIAPRRQAAVSLSFVSALGLLLSGLGLFGVISYGVGQRAREFGVRLALGARPTDVRIMVLRQGLAMTAMGLTVGVAMALAVTRALRSVLFGVGADEPMTIVGVVAVLTAASVIALYLPARNATKVDPAATLRSE